MRCQLWQVSETGYLGLGENRYTAGVIWRIDIEIDMGRREAMSLSNELPHSEQHRTRNSSTLGLAREERGRNFYFW